MWFGCLSTGEGPLLSLDPGRSEVKPGLRQCLHKSSCQVNCTLQVGDGVVIRGVLASESPPLLLVSQPVLEVLAKVRRATTASQFSHALIVDAVQNTGAALKGSMHELWDLAEAVELLKRPSVLARSLQVVTRNHAAFQASQILDQLNAS